MPASISPIAAPPYCASPPAAARRPLRALSGDSPFYRIPAPRATRETDSGCTARRPGLDAVAERSVPSRATRRSSPAQGGPAGAGDEAAAAGPAGVATLRGGSARPPQLLVSGDLVARGRPQAPGLHPAGRARHAPARAGPSLRLLRPVPPPRHSPVGRPPGVPRHLD